MVEQIAKREPNWWIRNKRRTVEDSFQFYNDIIVISSDLEKQGLTHEMAVSFSVGKYAAGMTLPEIELLQRSLEKDLEWQQQHGEEILTRYDKNGEKDWKTIDKDIQTFFRELVENLKLIAEARKTSVFNREMAMDL